YPVGFYFDEAANMFDIVGLGPGYHPIYFPNNNGREPLFFYWAAAFVRPLDVAPYALRVAAAFLGVATIPAVYFCISQMLRKAEGRRMARRVGLLSAAACAFLLFHVIFSRTGLRTITLPLFACLSFGLLWQAARLRSMSRFVVGGALLGLLPYTYTAARLLLAGIALYAIYYVIFQRTGIYWPGALVAAFVAAAVMAPLGFYAATHRPVFFERTEGVAVTDPGAVWRSTLAVLAMFNFHGTDEGLQNIPGLPVFDPWLGLMFLAGLVLCLWRLRKSPYVFALIWLGSVIPASALSPRAPYYLRLTGLIPPAVFLAALALAELPNLLRRLRPALAYAPALLVLASGGLTFHNYFQLWGPSSDAFYALMQDKVDMLPYLQRWLAEGNQVFLAPLYAQDWTYGFMTRGLPIRSFEAKDCAVLPPPGQAAVYAYPFFDKAQPASLQAHLPRTPRVEDVANSRGEPDLVAIHEPAGPGPSGTPLGAFAGQIALDRADVPTLALHPGDTVPVTLAWRALRPPDVDYTVFVHADENASHRRIQRDSMPCGGSFSTGRWATGQQVLDYYSLAIPPDAPAGTYTITTGLYAMPGPRNLKLDGKDATDLEAGSFTVSR
ncbi:MAG TPA: hypothetical protein VF157_08740, partial [Chloroflexota bacterium]